MKHPTIFPNLYRLLYAGLILLCITGCQKDEPGGGTGILPLSFPITVGNTWKYYTSSEMFDSNGVLEHKEEYYHYWKVEKDTMMFGVKAFKLSFTDSLFTGQKYSEAAYYTQNANGLYYIAVQTGNGNTFALNKMQSTCFGLAGIPEKYSKNGDLTFPDSPVCVLKYPYKDAMAWSNNSLNFKVWRKYLPVEMVSIPAGIFSCYVHSMWLDANQQDQNFTFRYYYSSKGLVQYTVNGKLRNGLGWTGTLKRKTQLVSVNF